MPIASIPDGVAQRVKEVPTERKYNLVGPRTGTAFRRRAPGDEARGRPSGRTRSHLLGGRCFQTRSIAWSTARRTRPVRSEPGERTRSYRLDTKFEDEDGPDGRPPRPRRIAGPDELSMRGILGTPVRLECRWRILQLEILRVVGPGGGRAPGGRVSMNSRAVTGRRTSAWSKAGRNGSG